MALFIGDFQAEEYPVLNFSGGNNLEFSRVLPVKFWPLIEIPSIFVLCIIDLVHIRMIAECLIKNPGPNISSIKKYSGKLIANEIPKSLLLYMKNAATLLTRDFTN